MPKVIDSIFGKLIAAVDNHTGEGYEDWRAYYTDKAGLIILYESEKKEPGRKFAYFFPNEPKNPEQPYLRTSMGETAQDGDYLTLETKNSRYIFQLGDFGITKEEKEVMIYNITHSV